MKDFINNLRNQIVTKIAACKFKTGIFWSTSKNFYQEDESTVSLFKIGDECYLWLNGFEKNYLKISLSEAEYLALVALCVKNTEIIRDYSKEDFQW